MRRNRQQQAGGSAGAGPGGGGSAYVVGMIRTCIDSLSTQGEGVCLDGVEPKCAYAMLCMLLGITRSVYSGTLCPTIFT
jgi:hypothetical protein